MADWLRRRFRLHWYLPLACALSGPALAFQFGWQCLWALSLLLQARLADDYVSRHEDQRPLPIMLPWVALGLVACNAGPLLSGTGWQLLLYGLFLLAQLRVLPSALKYGALAMLLDASVSRDLGPLLAHAGLVVWAASIFELGHNPWPSPWVRRAFGLMLLGLFGLLPWLPWPLATAAAVCLGFGLLRLGRFPEHSMAWRWAASASAYAGTAIISIAIFHP